MKKSVKNTVEKDIQEAFFTDWKEIETLVLGRHATRGVRRVYEAYQSAMYKLTQIQKIRVKDEEESNEIAAIVESVSKQTTIDVNAYFTIIEMVKKKIKPEIITKKIIQKANKKLTTQLKAHTATRKIKLK